MSLPTWKAVYNPDPKTVPAVDMIRAAIAAYERDFHRRPAVALVHSSAAAPMEVDGVLIREARPGEGKIRENYYWAGTP